MKKMLTKKKMSILQSVLIVVMVFCMVVGCASTQATSGENVQNETKSETAEKTEATTIVADAYADIEIEGYGTIFVALDSSAAPVTVENFVKLAESGFYDGLTFHRIMKDFMVQGGDPNGNGTGGSGETIVGEFAQNGYENNLSHTRGAISMARAMDFDSASSQFFIVHQDSLFLDGAYAVFGYVTEGMDIVDQICEEAKPTDNNGSISAEEQPVIKTITISGKEQAEFSFKDLEDHQFYFSSGAGGWRTFLNVDADGRFDGAYSDSDMGSVGEEYPNGTYYYCEFVGKFTEPVKVNDYTYSVKIEELSTIKEPDTSEIIDGVLYAYSTPYGIEGTEELLIYLPGAPTSELPEEYMNWVRNDMEDPEAETLPFYGLYNEKEQNGFSSYDASAHVEEDIALLEEWAKTLKDLLENEDLTQAEMNEASSELYATWDSALNILWNELKEELPDDEFSKLLDEQREWIKAKEDAVAKAGAEYEGGSMYSLVVNMEAADITEKRVNELYEMYQQLQ